MNKKKLWGGRFSKPTEKSVENFTESISFDKRLYRYDIAGSIAHAKMLGRIGLLKKQEVTDIVKGLGEIRQEIEDGRFQFSAELEDIHMNIEKRLTTRIGPAGAKLHTARSRNDQVALDLRLYLRDVINEIIAAISEFKKILVEKARANISVVMPGYTHLQPAQPVLFSHYLLAYWEMLERDRERFSDCLKRVCTMPLGSGAIAGTSFPIDREYVARLLGFDRISQNSMDAVSDRDFIIEFLSASALLGMHLSRLSEDMIIWSTQEFRFLELPDAYCTGSSMMPQKKNPDILELVRGKTGRLYGNLMSLLTTMKGLPLTYNRDLQEDKEPLFDTADAILSSLKIIPELVAGTIIRNEVTLTAASRGCMWATDVADYLVGKGVPFRTAHEITGKLVSHCINTGKEIQNLLPEELSKFSDMFDKDIYDIISPAASVNMRRVKGGTAAETVLKRLREIEKNKL